MMSRVKGIISRSSKRAVRSLLQNAWETTAYWFISKRPINGNLQHVVFVCKGNICRSAFAEYYLKSLDPEGTLVIESCGTDVDQGSFSPPEAVYVGKEFDLDLGLHRSKGVLSCDVHNADLILPMEYKQYLRLRAMFPDEKRKIRLLRDFAPWPDRLFCNINDPYGSNENEFRRCFRRLQRSVDGLKGYLTLEGRK